MTENNLQLIRNAALQLLARREHSKKELFLKLNKRFRDKASVEAVIADLVTQKWCQEDRFIEQAIHAYCGRGYGPLVIERTLQSKGISRESLRTYLNREDLMWGELAKKAKEKRWGEKIPDSFSEKAKWIRFLEGRGFTREHIQYALSLPYEHPNL